MNKQSWYDLVKNNAVLKPYSAKEIIQFQGHKSETIGLVISGQIETVSYSEDGDEIWIEEVSEGGFIGHDSFLKDIPCQYEHIAKSDVSLLLLSTSKMHDLLSADELLLKDFIQDFSERLHSARDSLVGAHVMSVKERICAELIRLSHEIGIEPDRYIIRPNPGIADMARRLNSRRETVSRTVSDLQKMGVLSREPGALIIENRHKLKTAFR